MINSKEVVEQFLPQLEKTPKLQSGATRLLAKLFHQQEVNDFIKQNSHMSHVDFLEAVNQRLGLSYSVSNSSVENVPVSGRVVIIANHPLGSLDGLALLALIHSIRKDVKIVVNDLLWSMTPLRPFFLPINNIAKGQGVENPRQKLQNIQRALESEQAVIFFPAGEVSRLSLKGIRDGKWRSGFLKMAKQTQSPILPIHVGGKNSRFFYGFSLIAKPLSALFLVREMFKNVSLTLPIKIGKLIPFSSFSGMSPASKESVERFKQHVYGLKREREELFETERAIAHPENRKVLIEELNRCEHIGQTTDGKSIYLLEDTSDSALLREIGRLREIAFRAVGEGTGNRRDVDKFDYYYKHIVLWDSNDLEIVGSYRIADINTFKDGQTLYSETLFSYEESLQKKFPTAMELGRSFIQPRYWGKRSLDYLWFGIGAYIRQKPHIRYLFGSVSLSNDYPPFAKDMLIYYFNRYFGAEFNLVRSFNPYRIKPVQKSKLEYLFNHQEQAEAFKTLKRELAVMGVTVPTLFKQYSDLCEDGGVTFYEFGVDPDFGDCIDSVVWVDLLKLKEKKRNRYID
ncbi:lysophospholipid acyltransferase family protein [Kangiella sediminilitoris]|uniref:L-ornithine N(alpha)-acyltransferase n=1 Tax=Kangiella sediminilitoris TaxID=1144748 RepID=A0A1B3BC04_9GAMM|nr:lysophospholipid acyltransferase family protein [Kangiella sediminilitoris]AOE50330.1 acyltransferase [Kangiella sediminilitoris]